MFGNARKYNQEGSWVYIDSIEMEKDMDLKLNELYKDQKLIITEEDRKEEQKYLEQLKASENTINSLKVLFLFFSINFLSLYFILLIYIYLKYNKLIYIFLNKCY